MLQFEWGPGAVPGCARSLIEKDGDNQVMMLDQVAPDQVMMRTNTWRQTWQPGFLRKHCHSLFPGLPSRTSTRSSQKSSPMKNLSGSVSPWAFSFRWLPFYDQLSQLFPYCYPLLTFVYACLCLKPWAKGCLRGHGDRAHDAAPCKASGGKANISVRSMATSSFAATTSSPLLKQWLVAAGGTWLVTHRWLVSIV